MMKKDYIGHISSYLGSLATIALFAWTLGKPLIENYIEKQVKIYTQSREYTLLHKETFLSYVESADFEKKLDNYLDTKLTETEHNGTNSSNDDTISLRSLLAVKMGVDRELVADEIARLFREDKPRLRNVMKLVNQEHPGNNIWNIDP